MLERMAGGARSLKDIDPDFWQWKQERERDAIFATASIVFSVLMLLGMTVAVRYRLLTVESGHRSPAESIDGRHADPFPPLERSAREARAE